MLDLGLVAEEVAKVEPLLTTTKDGRVEGVKYDRVGVVLVNAVVELDAELQTLKKNNNELVEEVKALKSIVCELKPEAKVCQKIQN